MMPINCPKCNYEVIPHETHKQRWEDCLTLANTYNLSEDNKIKIAINLFNELNDFIISDNIEKSKMKTTQVIQGYKRENIKKLNEQS